jgi:hypothetical protein
MRTIDQTREIDAASGPAAPLAGIRFKLVARLMDLWPPVMIAVGLVLTVVWAAGLVWLLVSLI